MTPEISLIAEAMRQAPTVGVILLVGYIGFKSYQKLVGQLIEVIQATTAAVSANTATMQRLSLEAQARYEALSAALDALPGKVIHEWANHEQARSIQRSRMERERS